MEKNISAALKTVNTLFHVERELVKLFKTTKKKNGFIKIGYVAGIITSDGQENIEINRKKLADHAGKLRKIHKFPMFSAVDVFSDNIYAQLKEMALPFDEREARMKSFWR